MYYPNFAPRRARGSSTRRTHCLSGEEGTAIGCRKRTASLSARRTREALRRGKEGTAIGCRKRTASLSARRTRGLQSRLSPSCMLYEQEAKGCQEALRRGKGSFVIQGRASSWSFAELSPVRAAGGKAVCLLSHSDGALTLARKHDLSLS